MHCPECGQQQVSDVIRFCSRCGLPLSLINEVLTNRGTLPELEQLRNKRTFISRKAGIFSGISWIFLFVLLAPIFLASTKAPGEVISFVVLLGIVTGLMMITASALFLDSHTRRDRKDFTGGEPNRDRSRRDLNYSSPNGLSPHQAQQGIPTQNYASVRQPGSWKTSDLAPGSVTENTTKFLDSE